MPVAYKIPLTNLREEFDNLDLRGTQQGVVRCPLGCGTQYALIYNPEEVDAIALNDYRQRLEGGMGICNQHPGKIVLNF